jgi:hypothetical protein
MPHTSTTQIAVDLYLHVRGLIGILLGLREVNICGRWDPYIRSELLYS